MPLTIISTQADLARLTPGSIFVPTMGALHEGHAALVRAAAARAHGRPVSVSIFVNPTQFNDPADYARYPKTFDADCQLCEQAGANIIFAPELTVMYPRGINPATRKTFPDDIPVPPLPPQATEPGLEDAHRPGHFAGVCQVVKRLFDLVKPAAAIFGEKDWQQLQVVKAMVKQQGMPIEIVPHATIREHDGLALSSRNRFLSAADRETALAINRALKAACAKTNPAAAEEAMKATLAAAGVTHEYALVRDGESLLSVRPNASARAIIAAKVGSVRLIDNCPWPAGF
jgi:pantoate--beta-alanine ligase